MATSQITGVGEYSANALANFLHTNTDLTLEGIGTVTISGSGTTGDYYYIPSVSDQTSTTWRLTDIAPDNDVSILRDGKTIKLCEEIENLHKVVLGLMKRIEKLEGIEKPKPANGRLLEID